MISNKCLYALRAMLELAKREGSGPVAISDIAREQRIPTRFLEAILRQLKQAGLTDSARGKDGGYFLTKPARSIRIGTVVRLFEGPIMATNPAAEKKARAQADVFAEIWKDGEAALSAVLDAISFDALAERERKRALQFVANYTI